jgi:PAS domain S-box-containing protein
MDMESLGTAMTVIGVPAGGACAWAWYRFRENHKGSVAEYQEIVVDLRKTVQEVKADYATLWGQFQDAEIRHDSAMAQLRADREADRRAYETELRKQANRIGRLQVDNQALRSELTLTRAAESVARAGLNPFFSHPGSWAFTIIVANAKGKILEANAGASILFHWAPEELLGRNLEVLIPRRYREAHQAGMAGLVRSGGMSQQGHTLALAGLTREGDEVPVEIYLESWTAQGELMCGAVIRRRWLAHEPMPGILSDDELAVVGPTGLPAVVAPIPVQVVNPPERPVPVQRADVPAVPAGEGGG